MRTNSLTKPMSAAADDARESTAGASESTGLVENPAVAGGGAVVAVQKPPFWRDVLSCTAQVYVVGWGVWGSLVAFFQSLWWHFLGDLGLSIYAIGVLFSLTVMVGCVAFSMNLCIDQMRPCLRFFIRHHWIWQGAVPAVAMAVALHPTHDVRTAATATAAAAAVLGLAAAMAGPPTGKLSQRVPASMTLGILILQSMRVGWSSATPTLDYGYAAWQLYGCALGLIAAVSLYLEGAAFTTPSGDKLEDDLDVKLSAAEDRRRSLGNCQSGRLCWAWLFVGPLLAGSSTLTLAFFTHPGAMPKCECDNLLVILKTASRFHCLTHGWLSYADVGWEPFPGGVVVVGGIVLGWGLCAFTTSAGRDAEIRRILLPLTVAGGVLLGSVLLFSAHNISGAFVLALIFPSMWTLTWFESVDMARQLAIGRVFVFAGLLVFVHVFCYVGVLTFGNTPVLGVIFGGKSDVWGYMVVLPMVGSILALTFLQPDDKERQVSVLEIVLPNFCDGRAVKLLPGVGTCGCGDAQNTSLAVVLLLMMLPAVAFRSINQARVLETHPAVDDELIVMAYNNQNGFDTDGHFNGRCFADAVRRHDADYVTVAEGDSMHFNTANRDALEFVASDLAYHADYGPAGYSDFVGVGTLSTRPFSADADYVLLPKPHDDPQNVALNRYMVVSKLNVGGLEVTIGGLHLEWFGDPSAQTGFIAKWFREHVPDGPAILIGDFNLEPPGKEETAILAPFLYKTDGFAKTGSGQT
jgi:endonuclease/exonuclease/phosphatase family metal-dependent hydrolase